MPTTEPTIKLRSMLIIGQLQVLRSLRTKGTKKLTMMVEPMPKAIKKTGEPQIRICRKVATLLLRPVLVQRLLVS